MKGLFGHGLYLVWLLGASLPILGAQWFFFGATLRRELRAILLGALLPALYLSFADSYAIAQRIWSFSDDLIMGVRIAGVPLEEVLFFGLTSLLVTQTMTLLTARK